MPRLLAWLLVQSFVLVFGTSLACAQNASPGGLAQPSRGFEVAPTPTTPIPVAGTAASWRPFLDPLSIHDSWYFLLIPMAFLMSMAYKAVRCHDMTRYWRAVIAMTIQVVLGMIALGAGFWLLIEFVLPRIAP